MSTIWNSLHFFTNQPQHTIAQHIQTILTEMGYTLYNPFNALTNKVYTQTTRLFLDDGQAGWWRIIGEFPTELPARLSADGLVIHLHLTDVAHVHVFADATSQPLSALSEVIRPDYTIDDLHHALSHTAPASATTQEDPIPMHLLPKDVQTMAQKVNHKQMNRMFQRMMGQVAQAMGSNSQQARGLLKSSAIDWASGEASKLRAFMQCLTLPQDWYTPDFITLRDAYQLHLRHQKNPNAPQYPGDAETMNAVPNALAYVPIYGGK